MQLQLNMDRVASYDTILNTDHFQEETMELIVPDSYADIYRIVDTNGQIRLTGKTIHDSCLVVNGVLDAWILYEPEDHHGICRIDAKVPFSIRQEGKEIGSESVCVALPVLRGLDSRMLNPRKLMIRADVGAQIKLYRPNETQLCTGIFDDADAGIQQLHRESVAFLVKDVQEKEFAIQDEIRLQSGPAGQGEIISTTVTASCTQAKVIGNKVIFKGEAKTVVQYLVEDHIYCAANTIPFSQIMEADHISEDAACLVDMCVTAVSCLPGGVDGRNAEVNIDLLAQVVMADKCHQRLLCDAYSTRHAMKLEFSDYTLRALAEHAQCTKNVCEKLQTEERVRTIVNCSVTPVQVIQSRQQEDVCLEGQLVIRAMYMDDKDEAQCLVRNMTVTGRLENPGGNVGWLRCICPGEVYATVAADGIEVRFDVEFQWVMVTDHPVKTIRSAALDTETDPAAGISTSVVLRMPDAGDNLWQLAKCYRTTMAAICRANELEDDILPQGRMLLIPRCAN